MLRLAERMWKFEIARRDAARREAVLFPAADDQEAPEGDSDAAQAADEPGAALYSPVNSDAAEAQVDSGVHAGGAAGRSDRAGTREDAPRQTTGSPLANAA
jgi:hypothetical protein